MAPKKRKGGKPKDSAKPRKKKVSILTQEHVEYVDWKDVNLLRKFMSERAKIRSRRVTGNDAQQQKEIARAIKNAREMALLPYTNRITTQKGGKSRGRDRDERAEDHPDLGAEQEVETATAGAELADEATAETPEMAEVEV